MPVSKKRKKEGKPVKPHAAPAPEGEQSHAPGARPADLPRERMGAPRNPFVSRQQQQRRGAQRGR